MKLERVMKKEKTVYNLAQIALLTLAAYFLADTVDAMIGRTLDAAPKFTAPVEKGRPALEPRHELSDYAVILERGLFGEGKGPSNNGASPTAAPTAYRLIGTIVGEFFSGAVLDDGANQQIFYRLDEKFPDGSRIVKVMRDQVSLKLSDGTITELKVVDDAAIVALAKPPVGASSSVRKVGSDKWMIDQREIAASTENMGQMLTQARALPYMEQGKVVGFRISEITPGSLYEKIGLVNGDVVQKVNSQDVDDPGKFFQLYQGLKEEKSISIDVLRNGQRQTFNYEIR